MTVTDTAIHANIAALNEMLAQIAAIAAEAQDANSRDERNLAIGTLTELEALLPDAGAILNTTLALHRFSKR